MLLNMVLYILTRVLTSRVTKISGTQTPFYMIVMTPKQLYLQDLTKNAIKADPAQALAVDALDSLYLQCSDFFQPQGVSKMSLLDKLRRKRKNERIPPRGVYLWGGVGRGKTYLMDTFYDLLPAEKKMRVHFHRFMYRIHDELKALKETPDPLLKVADILKSEADIICFDEFFVTDITDAMILGTLFQALFDRGIILVATSNIEPKKLYHNGLQRARFLPAIALIEKHCRVLNVDSGIDYRLRTLESADIYHFPNNQQATDNLTHYFGQLVGSETQCDTLIEVCHRPLSVLKATNGILFATFEQLCESARSQNDYIELSKNYHTVLLADVKQMGIDSDDAARRFIALVDEFYERHVKLIISAQVELTLLYTTGRLEFEFQRCRSRLSEMQSHEYLGKAHLG